MQRTRNILYNESTKQPQATKTKIPPCQSKCIVLNISDKNYVFFFFVFVLTYFRTLMHLITLSNIRYPSPIIHKQIGLFRTMTETAEKMRLIIRIISFSSYIFQTRPTGRQHGRLRVPVHRSIKVSNSNHFPPNTIFCRLLLYHMCPFKDGLSNLRPYIQYEQMCTSYKCLRATRNKSERIFGSRILYKHFSFGS